MKSPTIRALGYTAIAATLLAGVVYVASAYTIRNKITESRAIWNDYQKISSNRAQSLSALISNLGYGGMIDHFKTYIITGTEESAQQATLSAGAALAAIENYKASPLSEPEKQALGTTREMIMAYMKAINVANEAIMEGEVVSDIDKKIRIETVRPSRPSPS